jgi:hypothetical protein
MTSHKSNSTSGTHVPAPYTSLFYFKVARNTDIANTDIVFTICQELGILHTLTCLSCKHEDKSR